MKYKEMIKRKEAALSLLEKFKELPSYKQRRFINEIKQELDQERMLINSYVFPDYGKLTANEKIMFHFALGLHLQEKKNQTENFIAV